MWAMEFVQCFLKEPSGLARRCGCRVIQAVDFRSAEQVFIPNKL